MQLHQLRPRTAWRRHRRVGRGDKTAGRGTKGQKARAGAKIRPAIRDAIKKLPKRRGYRFRSFRPRPVALRLSVLAAHFVDGASIDRAALDSAGLIRRIGGRVGAVKVIGDADIKKRFTLRGIACSVGARTHIEAAGGRVLP